MSVRAQSGCLSPPSCSTSVGTQAVFLDDFTPKRYNDIYNCCSAAQAIKDALVLMLDSISLAVCPRSPPEEANNNPFLHVGSPP